MYNLHLLSLTFINGLSKLPHYRCLTTCEGSSCFNFIQCSQQQLSIGGRGGATLSAGWGGRPNRRARLKTTVFSSHPCPSPCSIRPPWLMAACRCEMEMKRARRKQSCRWARFVSMSQHNPAQNSHRMPKPITTITCFDLQTPEPNAPPLPLCRSSQQ